MKHMDCLLCRGVVRVFEAKLLNDTARFSFIGIEIEELCNCRSLLSGEQPLSKLHFAQMRLIHLSSGSYGSKWQLLAFAETAKPFSAVGFFFGR